MDFKNLASRLEIDEDEFMEFVDLFVTTTLSDIDKIKKAALKGNVQDAAAFSHSIKGAAGNLGFDKLYTLARDLEMQARQGNLDNFKAGVTDLENKINGLKNP